MEKEYIYILIAKYFNNECTKDEITFILNWYNQAKENKEEFIRLKKAWIVSDNNINDKVENARLYVWKKIAADISITKPQKYTKRTLIIYSSISAAIALLIMVSSYSFINKNLFTNSIEYTDMYIPKGEKGQMFLPDGTKVWLNSDSKLTISNEFNSKNRIVYLEGEAFFDVSKNEKHKFIVQTGIIDVVVHGTAFDVTAYPHLSDIHVSLQRGSIEVLKSDSEELLAALLPNEQITINKKTYAINKKILDSEYNIAWTFEELIFEHASVNEVFSKMENWYGVNIKVIASKTDLKYRFKVKSESLNEILQLINKMTPIEYHIDGKEVTVRYK